MNDNLLIESYRDFTFIFDKNTNVYFVSNCPNSDETADNCLDLSNFVEKENLEDVIDTVDSFYEDINTDVNDNSDGTDYIFIIKLKTIDGKFETVEFDDINNAQRYIDTLKIEGSHNYTEAYFLDEDGNELDSWIIADSDTNTEIKYDADESLTEDADTIISNDSDPSFNLSQPKDNGTMSDTFKKLPYLDLIKRDCYTLLKNKNSKYLNYIHKDFDNYGLSEIDKPKYFKDDILKVGDKDKSKLYIEIKVDTEKDKINFYFQVNLLFDNTSYDNHVDFRKTYSLVDFINDFDSYDWKRLFRDFSDEVADKLELSNKSNKTKIKNYSEFIDYLTRNLQDFSEQKFLDSVNNQLKNSNYRDATTITIDELKSKIENLVRDRSFERDVIDSVKTYKNDTDLVLTTIASIIIKNNR